MFGFLHQLRGSFQMLLRLVSEVVHAHLGLGHVKFLVGVIGGNEHKAGHVGVIHVDGLNPHVVRGHLLPPRDVQLVVGILHSGLIGGPVVRQTVFQDKGLIALQLDINKIADFLGQGGKCLLVSGRPEAAALAAVAREVVAQLVCLHFQIVLRVQILHTLQLFKGQVQDAVIFRVVQYKIFPVYVGQKIQYRLGVRTVQGHPPGAADPVFCGYLHVRLLGDIQLLRVQGGGDAQAAGQLLRADFQAAPLDNQLQNVVGENAGLIKPGNIGILPPGRLLVAEHHQHTGRPGADGQLSAQADRKEQRSQDRYPPPLTLCAVQHTPYAQNRQLCLDQVKAPEQHYVQNGQT